MNPRDEKLYNSIKKKYQNKMKNSAYRSGLIVKSYKKAYFEKYGNDNAYIGKRNNKKGLNRWFAEEWTNEKGDIGYDIHDRIYRPTKIVTLETPITWSELSKQDITKAKREKQKYGRVSKF